MRRRTWAWAAAVVIPVVAAGAAVFTLAQRDDDPSPPTSEKAETTHATPASPISPRAGVVRRLPVSGAPGFFVVINPDGSSYMESPGGVRKPLTGAGPVAPAEDAIEATVKKMADPPRKTEVGRLIVCDEGVVDVPKGAVVTFVGSDKVVTHNPDGSSTAYYTDGRVVRKDRTDRKPVSQPTGKEGSP